ncbi:maleylpyruvate isomerase family mycothiol-dependent enzyme [Tomitella biformata]|uniref:maleylpyruvate isomerase family mycothiol-dependent enzyme n=1 Tax=Tomitella biformata TaxID=630403 RepID=UPI00046668CF|nr:maleylpyruvate isomerase family mycothiol-dependent enzyme [Tomitella biformata]
MAHTIVPKSEIVPLLIEQWRVLEGLLADAPAQAWSRPTPLPGWSVQDVAAHVIGTESLLAGRPTPEAPAQVTEAEHVRNPMGVLNESWVESMRGDSPVQMLARWSEIMTARAAALGEMSQEQFDADMTTPVGPETYGRFMRVRTFDCWYHELDLRDALDVPGFEGGPRAEAAFQEISGAIPLLVGKRAAAQDGARVRLELTGDIERTVDVAVEGRAEIVAELDRRPDVTVRLPWGLFARLAGGRVHAGDHLARIEIQAADQLGRELGERLARNLRLTP